MKTRILLIGILLLGTVGGYAQHVETFVRHQLSEYATSHSVDYREAYHPHYRIIERSIFEREILPLLSNSVTTK